MSKDHNHLNEVEPAKVFAMMLLSGRPGIQFRRNQHLSVQQLAPRVRDSEQSTRINGGTLALLCGRSTRQLRVAHGLLKALGYYEGGRHMVAVGVQRHLPDELPKSRAAALSLIGCIEPSLSLSILSYYVCTLWFYL